MDAKEIFDNVNRVYDLHADSLKNAIKNFVIDSMLSFDGEISEEEWLVIMGYIENLAVLGAYTDAMEWALKAKFEMRRKRAKANG